MDSVSRRAPTVGVGAAVGHADNASLVVLEGIGDFIGEFAIGGVVYRLASLSCPCGIATLQPCSLAWCIASRHMVRAWCSVNCCDPKECQTALLNQSMWWHIGAGLGRALAT